MFSRNRTTTVLMLASITIAAFVLIGFQDSQAATIAWDDGGGDGFWGTGSNWSGLPDNTPPANGDTVTINGAFAVTYDTSDFLPSGIDLTIDGGASLTRSTVLRMGGSTITVGASGSLLGGFWDLNGATMNFADGASATMNDWEQKGTNVFNFELGTSGFTALNPNRFRFGSGVTIADATYNVDMANYTGGSGTITLVDFNNDNIAGGMDNTIFQGAGGLNVLNSGGHTANLFWNDTMEAIQLQVASTITWDNDSTDGEWKTPANWSGSPDNVAPIANDIVIIDNGNTVNWDGLTGQNLPSNLTVNLSGNSTWTATGVIRLNNATVTVGSGSTLSSTTGAFWDLRDADLTFEDGAIVTIDDWENKDTNTFTFNLGATGFSTLTPNNFRIGNGSLTGDIANATYNVDMTDYTGDTGIITLVDYANDSSPGGMTDTKFQTAILNILNAGRYRANLQWNDLTEAIELNITAVVPEPSTLSLAALGLLGLGLSSSFSRRFRRGRRGNRLSLSSPEGRRVNS